MTNKETDEAAERKQRLQTLRSKQKEQPAQPKSGLLAGSGSEGGDTSDRKREFIKKIMQKKMQENGGAGQGNSAKKKAFLNKAMKKSPGAGVESGKNAGQFPRLKALLGQGGGSQQGEASSVKLEELEARVSTIELALEKLLEMLEKDKK